MNKYLLSFLFIFFSLLLVRGQNLYIIVYKGDVFIEEKQLALNNKYAVTDNKSVIINENSKTIIFNENSFIENLKKDTYPAEVLEKMLIKKLPKSLNQHLITTHRLTETDTYSKGRTVVGIKGLNGRKAAKLKEMTDYAIPEDSSQVATHTVEINWKIANKINKPKLVVTEQSTGTVLIDKDIPDSGNEVIELKNTGWYDWEIVSSFDGKLFASNSFLKLTTDEVKIALDALNEFKASIAPFDAELQDLLLDDYFEQRLLLID